MSKNQVNPLEYGYMGNEDVIMSAELFQRLRTVLNYFLVQETQELYADNYKFIDKTTEKEVDKPNESTTKIVDVQKTLSSKEPRVYRTKEGVEILRLKLMTEEVHMSMIENGTAKHKDYFQNGACKAPLGETLEGTEE